MPHSLNSWSLLNIDGTHQKWEPNELNPHREEGILETLIRDLIANLYDLRKQNQLFQNQVANLTREHTMR